MQQFQVKIEVQTFASNICFKYLFQTFVSNICYILLHSNLYTYEVKSFTFVKLFQKFAITFYINKIGKLSGYWLAVRVYWLAVRVYWLAVRALFYSSVVG